MIVADILVKAKKLNHYEVYAAAGVTYWTSTTVYKVECPAGKRWFLLGGAVSRDVSSTVTITIKDASDNKINHIAYVAAAAGVCTYPNQQSGSTQADQMNYIIDAGEYLEILFGTAQSTAAFVSCVVLEVGI